MSEILTQVKIGQDWIKGKYHIPFYFVMLSNYNVQFFPKCKIIAEVGNE